MHITPNPVLEATSVTSVTLVGYMGEFPRKYGNCFSVTTPEGEMRIVNFGYENLKELEKRGVVEMPLRIHKLGPRTAAIADPRIPREWYDEKFCTVCTPRDLLPYPQRLQIELEILRGDREERIVTIGGKEMIMTSVRVKESTRSLRNEAED